MTGRRALVGLSLLCALAFTAFSAASASAATSGTTPVTCVDTSPTNNGDYTDAHCDTTSATKGTGRYSHVAIGAETTNVVGTNEKTASSTTASTRAVFEATAGGIATKLEATTVSSTSTQKKLLTGEVHETKGSNIVFTFSGIAVVNPTPCTVHSPGQPNGTVQTAPLNSFPVNGSSPHKVKFEPVTPPVILTLEVTGVGCPINGLVLNLTGTFLTEPSGQHAAVGGVQSAGATLIINVTKASGQVKLGGQPASLTSVITTKMEGGNPIASTEPIA
jgi:hypothetical protein